MAHGVPDLSALACDFMAFSGHKMYGPMGTGALVGRRAALERLEPLRYGGDMVAWVGLGIPVLVCAWYGWRRSPRTGSR
ncbi:Cysteine desulfurase [compost metagenome]